MALPVAVLGLLLQAAAVPALAARGGDGALHWSARKQVWDRRNQVVMLTGSAALSQLGERMLADEMRIDLKARTVTATGNCMYLAQDIVMQGHQMLFNLDTRTGSLIVGKIATEGFALSGEKISRIGEGRFKAINAEYTTCKDCPQSWSFTGEDVDLTFGGYARMKQVRGKVADVPLAWFPYLIFPLKNKRETGLLFPRFRLSGSDGLVFMQPFFWAIGRSFDMTLALGTYTARGARLEWEGRYALEEGSAQANYFFQRDESYAPQSIDLTSGTRTALGLRPNRWGLTLGQRQELAGNWVQTLSVEEVSDTNYPSDLGDLESRREAVLTSSFSLTRTTPWSSSLFSVRRFRNRLGSNPLKWDSQVVQPMPSITVTSNERPWVKGLRAGISVGFDRFGRADGTFDRDGVGDLLGTPAVGVRAGEAPVLGRDPIREASRLTLRPSIYSDWTPIDGLSLIPSAQYRLSHYRFDSSDPLSATTISPLTRGYLLTQLEASSEWARLYTDADGNVRYRHSIRPRLTYSVIPTIQQQREHPFEQQIRYAQEAGFSGYNFDNLDIVPRDSTRSYNNYFLPLGNSLSAGLVSQLYRKKHDGGIVRQLEFTAAQTFDFRELALAPSERQPLSRLSSSLIGDFGAITGQVYYYYYPYAQPDPPSSRHKVSSSVSYIFERALRKRVLEFERSMSLGYQYDRLDGKNRIKNLNSSVKFSLTDSILPFAGLDYNLSTAPDDPGRIQRVNAGMTFQSVSQCWKATFNLSRTIERPGTNLDFNLALNLAGEGFSGSALPQGF